jgi:SRSO17 transposase
MSEQAKQYLAGQIQTTVRRNLEQFTLKVPESNKQSLQHLVSNSPWGDDPAIVQLEHDVDVLLGDETEGALVLDESGIPKEGSHSVGVARQYSGALGKVDNCQIGVFLAYANPGRGTTLIDRRLYLPEKWTNDQARRDEAGVPQDITFQTKAELGLEMIQRARANGLRFGFVDMDAHYGEQPWLRRALAADGLIYMAEIPKTHRVFVREPIMRVPRRRHHKGRRPSRARPDIQPLAVEAFVKDHATDWQRLKIRDTERGELVADFAAWRVWSVIDNNQPDAEVWLIARRELGDPNDITYAFCNASKEISRTRLAKMLCTRYWVERALQNAKSEAGLDEYEVRGWRGWHHHMTLTLLAMLFLLELQMSLKDKAPMMTIQDAREILQEILPKREITEKDLIEIIRRKHQQRFDARQAHLKNANSS